MASGVVACTRDVRAYLLQQRSAMRWLEALLDVRLFTPAHQETPDEFLAPLQSGVVLVYALQAAIDACGASAASLFPPYVRLREGSTNRLFHLENEKMFLVAATAFGVPRHRIFLQGDCSGRESPPRVVDFIAALAETAARRARANASSASPSPSPAVPLPAFEVPKDDDRAGPLPTLSAAEEAELCAQLRARGKTMSMATISRAGASSVVFKAKMSLMGSNAGEIEKVERGVVCLQALVRGTAARRRYRQLLRDRTYREHVVREIYQTECEYVANLRAAVRHFLVPLRERTPALLPAEDVQAMFGNYEALIEVHAALEADLKERVDTPRSALQLVGDVFCKRAPLLTPHYEVYIDNFEVSLRVLSASLDPKRKDRKKFREFHDRQRETVADLHRADLNSFLTLPIQRIPRYTLLLRDLLKRTWALHPDAPRIQEGIVAIAAVGKIINSNAEAKRKIEQETLLAPEEILRSRRLARGRQLPHFSGGGVESPSALRHSGHIARLRGATAAGAAAADDSDARPESFAVRPFRASVSLDHDVAREIRYSGTGSLRERSRKEAKKEIKEAKKEIKEKRESEKREKREKKAEERKEKTEKKALRASVEIFTVSEPSGFQDLQDESRAVKGGVSLNDLVAKRRFIHAQLDQMMAGAVDTPTAPTKKTSKKKRIKHALGFKTAGKNAAAGRLTLLLQEELLALEREIAQHGGREPAAAAAPAAAASAAAAAAPAAPAAAASAAATTAEPDAAALASASDDDGPLTGCCAGCFKPLTSDATKFCVFCGFAAGRGSQVSEKPPPPSTPRPRDIFSTVKIREQKRKTLPPPPVPSSAKGEQEVEQTLEGGWCECYTDEGSRYYWHPSRGETTWERPDEIGPDVGGDIADWEEYVDDSGVPYFFNRRTSKSSWVSPFFKISFESEQGSVTSLSVKASFR